MSIRRVTLAGLATLGAAASLMVVGTPAWAVSLRVPINLEFGAFHFSGPSGVAIDQSNGNVFVAENGPPSILRVFNENGEGPAGGTPSTLESGLEFGGEPAGTAVDNSCFLQKLSPSQCAEADPSNGDIYVADIRNNRVDKFKLNESNEYELVCSINSYGDTGGYTGTACLKDPSEGTFSAEYHEPLGVAVDSRGNVYISNYGYFFGPRPSRRALFEYNQAGEEVGFFESPYIENPNTVAVDANGDVYVTEYTSPKNIVEFKRSSFTGPVESETLLGQNATSVAFDTATAALFIGHGSSFAEYKLQGEKYEQDAQVVENISNVRGIAINETSDEVYVSGAGTGGVAVFGKALFFATVATLGTAKATQEGLTLKGTVNPEGALVTSCEFEYGPTAAYGSTVPCEPAPGSGNAPVAVGAKVTGLLSATTYHYRIVASTAAGPRYGSDKEFTFVKVPAVNDRPAFASNVTQFGATLNGTIDPNGAASSYYFVWGATSAYGSIAPISVLYTPVDFADHPAVPQTLSGLQPGTTYHFALVATNAAGTNVGPDETFTTPAIPAPGVATGAVSELTLGAAKLTGTINPEGWSTTYWFEYGTTAAYGLQWPSVGVVAGAFSSPQSVVITVENLQPGVTYHYRLVAVNGGAPSYGADSTFTTPSYPLSVVQATPMLSTPLGVNPEATKSATKSKGKHKKKAKKKVRRRTKGRKKG
jgi:hypothetical protein